MKILSYKVLNEATVNLFNKNAKQLGGSISRDLLKTTRLSKKRGIEGASDTLKYMTRFIQLLFNIYDETNIVASTQNQSTQNQPTPLLPNDINVAFGIYFSDGGNKAHILPYYSNSIQDLAEQNLQYATLELFNPQDLNEKINIENYFSNFQKTRYSFKLKISNLNTFKNINDEYNFSFLNVLTDFANKPERKDITIGFNGSSGLRRLSLDRGQQNQNTQQNYSFIRFEVSIPQSPQTQTIITQTEVTQINNLFQSSGQQNCIIEFNNATRQRAINLPNLRYTTKITYQQNNVLYIYTTNEINTNVQPQNMMNNVGRIFIQLGNAIAKECNLKINQLT